MTHVVDLEDIFIFLTCALTVAPDQLKEGE